MFSYVLGKNNNAEKIEVYHKMNNNEIDVVATNAFGLGITILMIRNIVHVGLPESLLLSLRMQEYGQGRDGHQA